MFSRRITAPPKGPAAQRWHAKMDELMDKGMSRAQAASAIANQFPHIRERMVEEANRMR